MTPIEILQSFCANKLSDPRKWIYAPFKRGEYVYATNGHVVIRMPLDAVAPNTVQENPKAPKAEALFDEWMHGDFQALPSLPVPKECQHCKGKGVQLGFDCEECDGEGDFEHGSHTYTCKACDGAGFEESDAGERRECLFCDCRGIERGQAFRVGNACFDVAYLCRIAELSNVVFAPHAADKAGAFRFDGGEGLVMPMRM